MEGLITLIFFHVIIYFVVSLAVTNYFLNVLSSREYQLQLENMELRGQLGKSKLPGQIETLTPKKSQQHCKNLEPNNKISNASLAGSISVNLTITQEMLSSLLQGKSVNISINLKNDQ